MPTTLRVTLTDDGMSQLDRHAKARQKDPENTATLLLRDALRALPTAGRFIVLDGNILEDLERILHGGSVLNQEDLLAKVSRLAGITIANIRLDFSPGQIEEIVSRAERLSLTPEELTRRTVAKMEELFFTHLGVGV